MFVLLSTSMTYLREDAHVPTMSHSPHSYTSSRATILFANQCKDHLIERASRKHMQWVANPCNRNLNCNTAILHYRLAMKNNLKFNLYSPYRRNPSTLNLYPLMNPQQNPLRNKPKMAQVLPTTRPQRRPLLKRPSKTYWSATYSTDIYLSAS